MPVKIQVDNALDIADKNREKMKKLPMFDLSYFIGKSYFDGSQNYLMFNQFIIFSDGQLKILKQF